MKISDWDLFDVVFMSLVVGIAGFLGFIWVGSMTGCNESYSEGERVGIITKLSHKGSFSKTWEGQMNMGGMVAEEKGHLQTNAWDFTVREEDETSLKMLQAAQRSQKPVVIRYKGWLIHPVCQTDSGYMVQGVELVKEKPTK